MGFDIGSIIGSNLGATFKSIVGAFKLDPEKKAEFQAAIDANAAQLAEKQLEMQEKLQESIDNEISQASETIRADAQNGDKYTSRARPTFLYLMYVVLAWNYILLPVIQYVGKQPPAPINLPPQLFWLFGSGYLGYVGGRSWEKISGMLGNGNGKK